MDKIMKANALYKTLCQTLDNMRWHYNKDESKLIIITSAVGDDLTMPLRIVVDADRQVMWLNSPMPFSTPAAARDTMAKAVLMANYSMLNGSFEFDLASGYVGFKMVIPFMESIISEDVCHYMIVLSCNMADKFNDKFHAIAEGRMTIKEFEDFIHKS